MDKQSAGERVPTIKDVQRVLGFVPPAIQSIEQQPANMRAVWSMVQCGYLENTLPALFKERFLTLVSRECTSGYVVAVRCAALSSLGLAPAAIVELLATPMPSQATICERIRTLATGWTHRPEWASMATDLETWVLWATVRFATRRDPGGRCQQLLCELLDAGDYSMIVLLVGYAAMYRTWCAAYPELAASDQTRTEYEKLLEQAPDLRAVWEQMARKSKRHHVTERERELMAEIGRQDRVREALRQSERRFRRIVENSPFPLMIYAEDGQVVMLNRTWQELSGWEEQHIPDIQTWIEKAQVDRTDWSAQDLEALRGWDQAIDEGEQRIQTRNGQIRRWSFSTAALGKLGDGRQAIMRMAVDVTERRELEDALWDTNRQLQGLLDSITDGFIAMDRDTRFQYANEKLVDILRLRREDLIGRLFTEVFPYVTHMPLNAAVQRCLHERTTEHIEHYSPRVDTFYEVHLYPTEEGLAGFIRDIGERKRIEQQLRASERRFRGLFESNMLGIMFANRFTGAILDCNDAMLRMLGYTREELRQGKMNWIHLTAPEHRPADVPAVHEVGNGPLVPYEKDYIHKDGHRVPVLIGGAPITRREDVVMAFVIDRSEQKRLEQESQRNRKVLHAVVRGAPLAVTLIAGDGKVELWNPAAEKLFGWTANEATGRPCPFVVEHKWTPFIDAIREIMQGKELPEAERPVRFKSGETGTVLAKALPARDEEGRVIGALILLRPLLCDCPAL